MENTDEKSTMTFKEKFEELKTSISNLVEEKNTDIPLGEKLKTILVDKYEKLLTEEKEEFSVYSDNDVLKNLLHKYVKNDSSFKTDNNFSEFYSKYIEKMNSEFEIDLDELESQLHKYSELLVGVSENIKSYEKELLNFFIKLDNIKNWITSIPNEITVNKVDIYNQIRKLEDNEEIINLIKKYKEERIKYFYLKHYYYLNPFISLAEENNDLYNSSSNKFTNDLDEPNNLEDEEDEEEEPVGFIRYLIRKIY
jgi:hypothetical protein